MAFGTLRMMQNELVKSHHIFIVILSWYKGEYKVLRGMFPTSAGKIASNGPYSKVCAAPLYEATPKLLINLLFSQMAFIRRR